MRASNLSISIPQFQNQKSLPQEETIPQCIHNKSPGFICRNEACLRNNNYLVCTQQCMENHFKHPQDLIDYQIFHNSLKSLRKSYSENQFILSSKIREIMNRLLHLRVTISQYIDTEIQIIKKMLIETKSFPQIKDCIYLIKQYNKNEEYIAFELGEEEKEVNYFLGRSIARLTRSIYEITSKNIEINQCQNIENNKKKTYEYKIQGSITKILKLLKTTPQHVEHLKIYLNEEYIFNFIGQHVHNLIIQIWEFSLRIYKESYENLMKAIEELDQIKKARIIVWDNYLKKEDKLQMIKQYRQRMKNMQKFIIEDKLKSMTYEF